ncbi:MAG: tungstate transport system permease protein [Eubacteriaceae bacterium]|nr:tungstate transport system permease protein [Eubacteriaceae bacterium]
MDYILEGFVEAIQLILSFDPEIYQIVSLSLFVSFTSTAVSTLIGVPAGIFLGIHQFRGKKWVSRLLYTFMSFPPVIIGLFTALLLSRSGPFGQYKLMYTSTAMIIAQTLLVTPIITGVIFNYTSGNGQIIVETGKTLGAKGFSLLLLIVTELRATIMIALVTGFGRAISEVGAVMIVGGNIKGYTRVMTTFIAMNNNMGEYSLSIAMGLILMTISFITNSILYKFVIGDLDELKN